jgi:hypothetical protein
MLVTVVFVESCIPCLSVVSVFCGVSSAVIAEEFDVACEWCERPEFEDVELTGDSRGLFVTEAGESERVGRVRNESFRGSEPASKTDFGFSDSALLGESMSPVADFGVPSDFFLSAGTSPSLNGPGFPETLIEVVVEFAGLKLAWAPIAEF